MTLAGIDVSNLQGASFDWAPYKGRIQFAFIKVSEGTGFADPDAARNVAQARELDITVGLYHFLHVGQPVQAQAEFFLKLAKSAGLRPGDLVMTDYEVLDGRSPADAAVCAAYFAHLLCQDTGAWPVTYTDQSMPETGCCAGLGMTPAFIANPSHVTLPSPIGPWPLVSFEQTGQRGVDTDVFYGDAAALGKLAIPHPAPPKPPVRLISKAAAEAALAALTAYVAQD